MKKLFTLIALFLITSVSSVFGQKLVSWESYFGYFEVAPMAGLELKTFVVDSNSISVPAVEVGVGLINGGFNLWETAGGFPLGADWGYWGPYGTLGYSFNTKKARSFGMTTDNVHNGLTMDVGVTAGVGAIALILPLTVNGTVGYKTDFSSSALKYSIGFNMKRYSLNFGNYFNFDRSSPLGDATFVELKAIIWDKL
jgi:hypothetical protein